LLKLQTVKPIALTVDKAEETRGDPQTGFVTVVKETGVK
jgi:hypothetical protein